MFYELISEDIMFYKKIIKILGLFTFAFFSLTFAQDDQNSNKELKEEYIEYQLISQKLMSIQQQALSDSEIAKQSTTFGKKLDSAMVEETPSIKQKLEKRDEIIDNFQEAQENGNQDKILKLQEDYKSISGELQVHQQNALQDENLRKEGEELNEKVIQKMTDIEPDVPKLFSRLKVLGEKLKEEVKEDQLD